VLPLLRTIDPLTPELDAVPDTSNNDPLSPDTVLPLLRTNTPEAA
jgi:hypothetical protein